FEAAPFEWVNLRLKLGNTSGALAREEKDANRIYIALSILESGLQRIPAGLFRELRAEILLGMAQLHLARAIGEHWETPLQRAILVFQRALAEPELKSSKPLLWSQNQQKWAAAKLRIARHTQDARLASEAIDGLLESLKIFDVAKHAFHCANIHHDLGSAYLARAELLPSNHDLAAAEAAYRQA